MQTITVKFTNGEVLKVKDIDNIYAPLGEPYVTFKKVTGKGHRKYTVYKSNINYLESEIRTDD